MPSHLGVDVGGTFTDLAYVDADQQIRVVKSPTTPSDYPLGIENCIDLLAEVLQTPPGEILGSCTQFIHGSTVVTNAVVEGRVAKVGLLVTAGFRDILTLREGGKADPYNLKEHYPQPYIPRYLTLPVTERINSEGGIEIPMDEVQVLDVLRTLIETYEVEAVAVCLLWSIANPQHEVRIKEIAAQHWPALALRRIQSFGSTGGQSPLLSRPRCGLSRASTSATSTHGSGERATRGRCTWSPLPVPSSQRARLVIGGWR